VNCLSQAPTGVNGCLEKACKDVGPTPLERESLLVSTSGLLESKLFVAKVLAQGMMSYA